MHIAKMVCVAVLGLLLAACNFSKSIKVDFENNLVAHGDGLSVDKVFVTTESYQPNKNTFAYGSIFYTNFDGLSGFTMEDGDFFPELEVFVIAKSDGDTLLQERNLLGGLGQPRDVEALNGHLILANPIRSGDTYTAKYRLYDARGDGQFFSEMDFDLVRDPNIHLTEKGLAVGELYITDKETGMVITDGQVPVDKMVAMNFQFLEGYRMQDGKIDFGMRIRLVDATGKLILSNRDALRNIQYPPLANDEVIMSTLTLNKGRFNEPLQWMVTLWDKNGDGELTVEATLTTKQ